MNKPIAVLGAGAWGSALAILLANNQQPVLLWDADEQHLQDIQKNHCNQRHLPSLIFPELIKPVLEVSEATFGIQDIFIVVPSHAFTDLLEKLSPLLSENARIAWATKGLDPKTSRLFHEIVMEIRGKDTPMAVISGPSFAKEVAEGKPTQVILAANQAAFAQDMHFRLYNPHFHVEMSQDLIGVQLCGALKNVIAIAIGMSDGLSFGANARCALITKALKEITLLGESLGAKPETFFGLAGLGDIILTSTDNQSRNRRFGFALGQGHTIEAAKKGISQTIEGEITTLNAHQLAQRHRINCHFIEKMYGVLYQEKSAKDAIISLLGDD